MVEEKRVTISHDFNHLEGEEEKKEHNHDTNEDVHMNDSMHSIKFSLAKSSSSRCK
jgi:hypothetical protein